jgi:putative transposase
VQIVSEMPRPILKSSSLHPYHVRSRCINRDWFSQPMEEVWEIMSEQLFFINHAFKVKIHAFVLMSNHYHMLISTPEGNLSESMAWFNRETSRSVIKDSERINQTYGGRFKGTLITSFHHFINVYKYIYRNPVTAGICKNVEAYPFSTLHGLLGLAPMTIPMELDTLLFENMDSHMDWLNLEPKKEHLEEIRKGLKKSVFALSVNRTTRKKSALEDDAL